jgi:hypothetical protein
MQWGGAHHQARAGDRLVGLRQLDEAEVDDLDERLPPGASRPSPLVGPLHEEVGGLEIAVNHPLLVRVAQPAAHLLYEVEGAVDRQRAGLEQVREPRAVDVLHRQEGHPVVGGAEVVHHHHVRVVERRQRRRLEAEPLLERRALLALGRRGQELERHLSLEPDLPREVHRRHAAPGDQPLDAIPPGDDRPGAALVARRGGVLHEPGSDLE